MKVLKKITQNILGRYILGWILLMLVFMFLVPGAGYAVDKFWIAKSGYWHSSSNWDPYGQPINGDNVFLAQSDSTDRVVIYYNTVYPSAVLNVLRIDATGSGTMTFAHTYYPLASNYEYVGYNGTGAVIQSNGTNTITNNLYLGYYSAAVGTYELSNTGSLSAGYEYIGRYGTGIFTQSGGTNSASTEYIGYDGTGTFTQTGGTNTITNALTLGFFSSSVGTYELSGGSLSAGREDIGYDGTGTFTQTGGTNTITNYLILGSYSGSVGTYKLSGTGSLSADYEYIGYDGTGTFTQSGGTNTVEIDLIITNNAEGSGKYVISGGTLTAGSIINNDEFEMSGGTVNSSINNNGVFTYTAGYLNGQLVNDATVNLNGDFTASNGMINNTSAVINTGRVVTLNGSGLENNGSMYLYGTLQGYGPQVNNGQMYAKGTIGGSGGFTNNAILTQSNGNIILNNTGANANKGFMTLASNYQLQLGGGNLTNSGSLNLNGAIVNGASTLNNTYGGTISGQGIILSGFNNNGGRLLVDGSTTVSKSFNNSGAIQLAGNISSLTGGAITNTGSIQGVGQVGNNVTNSGTIEALGGTLTMGGDINNASGGLITASSGNKLLMSKGLTNNSGVINLTGGIFDNNNHTITNSNQMSGYGTFRTGGLINEGTITLTGGTTTVNGDVTNQDTGKIEVAYNPAIFTGNVINNGTFKTTDTNVAFAGTFTNNGAYISDPSTNYYYALSIGANGYMQGGLGDNFYIETNLINNSTQNVLWDTDEALLGFTGTGTHNFYLTGEDLGADILGYTDNFAWGTLNVEGNLNLFDGNATEGGAQYLSVLDGAVLLGDIVSNISGQDGLNIYYLASASGNEYLNGLTYNLTGGGFLIPVENAPVPVPPAVWLFISGFIGLVLMRKRNSCYEGVY